MIIKGKWYEVFGFLLLISVYGASVQSVVIDFKPEVYVSGFAYWTKDEPYDPVIWRAKIEKNLIQEWQIFVDTPENRERFHL